MQGGWLIVQWSLWGENMSEDIEQYKKIFEKHSIKISERPNPVPYNYRITFRMAELCLIMRKSTSYGISVSKINMLCDALSTQSSLDRLKAFVHNKEDDYRVKYDPLVIRILQYLIFDGLVIQQQNQKYKVTDKGKSFVKSIIEDDNLLIREKQILDKVGKALKEDKIEQLQLRWRY